MKRNKQWLIILFFSLGLVRCGVKGEPLPPEEAAPIGRGRPTFKRAFEDIKVEPSTPSAPAVRKSGPTVKDEDSDEDEENENEKGN